MQHDIIQNLNLIYFFVIEDLFMEINGKCKRKIFSISAESITFFLTRRI